LGVETTKLSDLLDEEVLTFKSRKIITQVLLDHALDVAPERVQVRIVEHEIGRLVQGLITVATQEEEVYEHPEDWWQSFKERWFPEWLKKRYPVRMNQVWAIHKFPELNIPMDLPLREFIHFRVVNDKKLERLLG
jgi:hypothetical protein